MSDAEKALDGFNELIQILDNLDNSENRSLVGFNKAFKTAFAIRNDIRRALKITAAVDGDELVKTFSPSSMVTNMAKTETMNYVAGNNALLERLRGIK